MKRLFARIRQKFNNTPLQKKLIALILCAIVLLTTAGFLGIRLVLQAGNRMLYQALAGSLSYSASDISGKLSNVEAMSNAIISNKLVSKNLITLYESDHAIARNNALSSLSALLFDYHQSYRNSSIRYITLTYPGGSVSSYDSVSRTVAPAVHDAVKAAAGRNSGYTCWVTDFANSDGLYLGRDSRRINHMKFETLGTLMISVDMEKLIKTSTKSILLSEQTDFIFTSGEQVIYTSKGLLVDNPAAVSAQIPGQYAVLKLGSERYFALRGTLSNINWDYVCLIPYGNIAGSLRVSFLLSLSIVLLSAAAAIWLSRRLVRSLTVHFSRLVYKMEQFGKNESVLPVTRYDYSVRQDEIGLLHNQFDGMALKIQRLIQENYVNEILAKDAKLQALENQINPHFLYNTLESVNWRAKASGEKEISIMVEALGALLRTTLSAKATTCTVGHELQIVKHYIDIQKLRFEERLVYLESMDHAITEAELPQLTIQPLVENAINYVLEEIVDACIIEIRGRVQGDQITIQVINTGSQFAPDTLRKLEAGLIVPHGFGIGLLNIHKRIQLIYGPAYGLTLYNSDEEHAVAEICIPGRNPC